MNPFDLPGPEFLTFYLTAAGVAVIVATWLRRRLRAPADEGDVTPASLSAYHLAYLAGGQGLALNAAVAALVQRRALRVDRKGGALTLQSETLSAAHPLERSVHQLVAARAVSSLRDLHRASLGQLDQIRERLEQEGLLVPAGRGLAAQLLPLLLVLAVVLTGAVK